MASHIVCLLKTSFPQPTKPKFKYLLCSTGPGSSHQGSVKSCFLLTLCSPHCLWPLFHSNLSGGLEKIIKTAVFFYVLWAWFWCWCMLGCDNMRNGYWRQKQPLVLIDWSIRRCRLVGQTLTLMVSGQPLIIHRLVLNIAMGTVTHTWDLWNLPNERKWTAFVTIRVAETDCICLGKRELHSNSLMMLSSCLLLTAKINVVSHLVFYAFRNSKCVKKPL